MIEWDGARLRHAIDAAEVALWSWNVDDDAFLMDERGHHLWGMLPGARISFADLAETIHPPDQERVRAAFVATRNTVGRFDIDFRIRVGSEVRWIAARGQGDDYGSTTPIRLGVFLDISARKDAEEGSELLAQEMVHRVKNLLAIAAGLAEITSRSATSVDDMADQLRRRLIALGRAHELVGPTRNKPIESTDFSDLLAVLLSPYVEADAAGERIRIDLPKIVVGELAATSLALVIHEIATNSLKHGALSSNAGSLEVSGGYHEGTEVLIVWTERGGPPVSKPEPSNGFGSKVVARSMSRLGGSIDYDWRETGLVATLRMARTELEA